MRTTATFRLFGRSDLTSQDVTAALGLLPTRSYEAGEPVGRGSDTPRTNAAWMLQSSNGIEDGVELATQLTRILDLLESRAEQLWALVGRGYEANWFCFVESTAAEHAIELDRQLLKRLLALPGDLWLDVA